jgi:hypothetical protein
MPWCEECAKYWTPNSMNEDGTCPQCGELVEEPHVHRDDAQGDGMQGNGVEGKGDDDEKTPWHFKLLVVTLVVYLGWRFWQLAAGSL